MARQPDGKLVVAGSGELFPEGVFYVARYNANGNLDSSFGTGGIVSLLEPDGADALQSVVIQPDGKIIAGGFIHNLDSSTQLSDADFYLLRLNQDGTLDNTFGSNGQVTTDLSYF